MNKIILIGIFLILVLILFFGFLLKKPQEQEVLITTDKTEYALGEAPIMTIKNNLAGNICFSGCYPYYLQKNNGQWQSYHYEECQKPDLVEGCVEVNQAKGFELIVYALQPGFHRIAVPSCLDCRVGEAFREDGIFYSNEFNIR